MHRPVLLSEAVEGLAVRPHGVYVDGTFGRGGHSRAILERLGPSGRVIALDRDPEAERAAKSISDPRFSFLRTNFAHLAKALEGLPPIEGMLFDLGVSSPQLDDPARGFSFRADGPLDMRMDPASGEPVSAWLARAGEPEIREVIATLGEERFARRIAAGIVAARSRQPLTRTLEPAEI